MKRHAAIATAILLTVLMPARAQDVMRTPDDDATLDQKWAWAADACGGRCVVGYSIQRMMGRNSYTGWMGDRRGPTLQSIVYGHEVEPLPSRSDRVRDGSELVLKEVALLFRFDGGEIREIDVSNISLPVDLEGNPLLWLGLTDQRQSIRLLRNVYAAADDRGIQEDLVSAVGMHGADDLVVPFLTQVLESDVHDDVREQSVFWLAESQHASILPLLERTARTDRAEDVRDQAVFGISRIETDEADELLIALARGLDDRDTREQAIFWLGQKASEKAAASLEDIAENDPDLEIQKRAVFAISQLPEDEGIPRLITIARTHRTANVRHEAIFWLGESGDERAVDELVRIVRGE